MKYARLSGVLFTFASLGMPACGGGGGETPGTGSGGLPPAGIGGGLPSGGSASGGTGPAGTGGSATGGTESGVGGTESAATGGALSTGGETAAGGSPGSGGGGSISDAFEIDASLASDESPSAPGTVGIVTWSIPGTVSNATIEFGLTTEYGMTAPVDLDEEGYRTLLLGMKPGKDYHFRITATVDGQVLMSEDQPLTTGPAPAAGTLAPLTFTVASDEKREKGFIVTSYWQGAQSGMVFILDQDGDIVWWHASGVSGGVAKAAISDDGKDMWMISASNQGQPVRRVSMDTLDAETYSNAVGSHDIQPVEGDVMVFIEYGETGCDSAFEINKAGETKEVLELEEFTPKGSCHANAIAYNKEKATYAMSSLDTDVFMFPRAGGTVQNTSLLTTKAGAISTWGGVQHGVQLLNTDHLLIFANREGGNMGPSVAIEYSLDDGSEVFRYEGGQYTANLGDVQRLPGGNTLVTYSNAGILHEVTPAKEKVLEITGAKNLGYAVWRASLYGPSEDALE